MMKNVNFIKATATIMLTALSQVTAISQTYTLNQSYGSIVFMEDEYVNNMHKVFYINTGVNKPVEFELNYDIEEVADFISIYEVDNAGNEYLTGTYTGVSDIESHCMVRTSIPNGKAKFVFHTDVTICGEDGDPTWASGTYYGIECYFNVDGSFTGTVNINDNMIGKNLWLGNNAFINGKLGVGTISPAKKVEFWDGNAARFTFSGSGATSGYEVAQTMDNTGYKLNVANSSRNYKIALNGTDMFKLLQSDNYALGTNALAAKTSGNYNFAAGYYALNGITTGSSNIGLGSNAGRYIANGSTANTTASNSIFIGQNTKAQANGQNNQIVIGYNATGAGSNTVTLGSTAITKTVLRGNVMAQEITIDNGNLPDFVFAPDYRLMSLGEIENFIKENSHLPALPSAKEVKEKGMNVAEMQNLLLQKIEELTLHIIQQDKRIEELENKLQGKE